MGRIAFRDGKVVFQGNNVVTVSRCLPDTVTVTFSGFATARPDRCYIPLSFTSCFGSGAAGTVGAPVPDGPGGAVFDPILSAGGSGYAVLGRIEPNIMLTVLSEEGQGAELSATLTEDTDECGRPFWYVSAVTVDDGGTALDGTITVEVQVGNFPEYRATPNTVTGTGARIRATWYNVDDFWECGTPTILAAGTGYTVGDTFDVVAGLVLTVATVGGGGEILTLTVNQTAAFPVLETFESPIPFIEANLDRSEPTLSLNDYGGGATFTVNLVPLSVAPGLETWTIDNVVVDTPGAEETWMDNDSIFVEENPINEGEGSEFLTIRTTKSEPEIALSGGGIGADFVFSYTEDGTAPDNWWYLNSITLGGGGGGTGYYDGEYLSASGVDFYRDILSGIPSIQVRTVRAAPTLAVTPLSVSGTGAAISLSTSAGTDFEGRDSWSGISPSIDTAGTGYVVGDTFTIETTNGYTISTGELEVTSVGGSGEITGVTINSGGEFFLDTGVVEEVVILDPGYMWHDDGDAHSVVVAGGGEFYERGDTIDNATISEPGVIYTEDPTEPVIVASVTVGVADEGVGSGATFTVTIDEDPESLTFGQITDITLDTGGTDYVGTIWIKPCCGEFYDGRSIVLKRGQKTCSSVTTAPETPSSGREAPAAFTVTPVSVTGTDAVITATTPVNTSFNSDNCGGRLWQPYTRTILAAGTGYTVGDTFIIGVVGGFEYNPITLTVSAVDGGGGITALAEGLSGGFGDGAGYWQVADFDTSANTSICYEEHRHCNGNSASGQRAKASVVYRGPTRPPRVIVDTDIGQIGDGFANQLCDVTMESTTLLDEDDPFEFTATAVGGQTAVVTEGGTYDEEDEYKGGHSCSGCCNGKDTPPCEMTIGWERTLPYNWVVRSWRALTALPGPSLWTLPPSGDYVLVAANHARTIFNLGVEWDAEPEYGVSGSGLFLIQAIPCRNRLSGGFYTFSQFIETGGATFPDVVANDLKCNECAGCAIHARLIVENYGDGVMYPTSVAASCAELCNDTTECFPAQSIDLYAWVEDIVGDPGVRVWAKVGTITLP